MDKVAFKIKYDGPALVAHEMDVKDLAPALLSLGELLEESNKLFNGDGVALSVKIQAASEGSIDVGLSVIQDIVGQAATLFAGTGATAIVNAKDILEIVGISKSVDGGMFGLVKWLRNRKIKSITTLQDGNFQFELEEGGEARVCNERSVRLFGWFESRRKTEAIIRTPLLRSGVESVSFYAGETESQTIQKEEADYFAAPQITEEVIDDREIEANLQIVNISFQEDGKWKFNDGSACFFAEILDREFTGKVQENQAFFAKDDILRVNLNRKQYLNNGNIRTDYAIVKVLEHRSAAIQIKLPFAK